MKNKFLLPSLFASALFASVFTSCQQNTKPATATSNIDSLNNKVVKKAAPPDSSDNVILPSPLQIGSIFKNAGLTYVPGLTNSVKDVSQYTSTYSEALNMGIYGADLSYCVLNKQTQDALSYLKTLRTLADKIGFGSIFESNSLAKRFEANLNSEDSLTSIIADLQMEADTYLTTNRQKYVSAITFAGAWIESMYVGSKVYAEKKTDKVSSRISEQMNILHNLIKTMEAYESQDAHIGEMVTSLKAIETSFMSYDEVKKTKPDSDETAKLTDAHIAELGKQIQELRQKFVS
jgi:hypothetical protein